MKKFLIYAACLLVLVLPCCGLLGIGGEPRVTTPEERLVATTAVNTAVAAGKLAPEQEAQIRALIEESGTNPLTRETLMLQLLTLGLAHLAQRLDRGAPERVRQKKAEQARVKVLLESNKQA